MDFGRKVMRFRDFRLHHPVKAQEQQPEAIKIVTVLGEGMREFLSSSLRRAKFTNRLTCLFSTKSCQSRNDIILLKVLKINDSFCRHFHPSFFEISCCMWHSPDALR
jgi:hypothetical protein